jgi:uncharacterized membrane protein YfcA
MVETLTLIIMGIFSGIVSGMTGASGVMVMIPLLTTFFGFPILSAIGTSLMADVISSGPIAYTYHRSKNLDWKTGCILGAGALLGAQVATQNISFLSEDIIVFAIGVSMVGLGLKMWRDGIHKEYEPPKWMQPLFLQKPFWRTIVSLAMGVILGIMTGFFGAGGGILIFLVLYFLLRIDLKTSIGTAAFVMLASSLSGAIGHWRIGDLDWQAGIIIGLSATAGGVFAAYLANRVEEAFLSRIAGILFIALALIMMGIRLVS